MGNGKNLYRGIKKGGYQWLMYLILSILMCCKAMAL